MLRALEILGELPTAPSIKDSRKPHRRRALLKMASRTETPRKVRI